MLTKTESLYALQAYFKKNRLATMTTLLALLQTTSRMSVFRRLQALDYLCSYTHAGRYYTLRSLVHFDDQGLWHNEGVGFSKAGHLKKTVMQQVAQSEAGKTHDELETQLQVRVHNTLLDLLRSNSIARESFQGVFLYLSSDLRHAKSQREKRNRLPILGRKNALPDWLVIEVLVEIIRHHPLSVDGKSIAKTLDDRGIAMTSLQVEQVLNQMDIKKHWAIRREQARTNAGSVTE